MANSSTLVNFGRKGSSKKSLDQNAWKVPFGKRWLGWLSPGVLLLCTLPLRAQSQQSPNVPGAPPQEQAQGQQSGTISGTVVDGTGAVVPGANVKLSHENQSPAQETTSDSDGQFFFDGIAPGPFQLTVSTPGFAEQMSSGTLHPGENYIAPPITLAVAATASEVHVALTPIEIAEAEIKDEEKQRVLGVIPNFYVTYNPAAVPLHPRQKFELAWRNSVDPINFGLTAAVAGLEQATNFYSGYGQGVQGYGKRFGASYANSVTSTFIGSAILPSVFKQDPRYFYKGTGSRRSRFLYAVANAVICKGDNRHWQANYSYLLGDLAASGIANLYYPETDRGAALTFENALIGIGATAANNVLQEFVVRKLTRNAPKYTTTKP
jgi:carboxypeptidase family protein